jgi:hypothetical protein
MCSARHTCPFRAVYHLDPRYGGVIWPESIIEKGGGQRCKPDDRREDSLPRNGPSSHADRRIGAKE